jgi:hypothetical protein
MAVQKKMGEKWKHWFKIGRFQQTLFKIQMPIAPCPLRFCSGCIPTSLGLGLPSEPVRKKPMQLFTPFLNTV